MAHRLLHSPVIDDLKRAIEFHGSVLGWRDEFDMRVA